MSLEQWVKDNFDRLRPTLEKLGQPPRHKYNDEGGPPTIKHRGGQRPNVRPDPPGFVRKPPPAPADKR